MNALYNENAPFAAAWLEDLETHGHIPKGRVDRRSITELTPGDVAGTGQRHFFAGIGGWAHALRLAGVRDTADVWTGSCPCQGLSDAGARRGFLDPRHLWPAWFALIRECRPPIIFGEQVASGLGLEWLDLVFSDLERCGYAVGAADLCAAGVGAPHRRQRLYFVAYTPGDRRLEGIHAQLPERGPDAALPPADRSRQDGVVVDTSGAGGGRDPRRECPGHLHRRLLDVAVPAGTTRGFWADAEWVLCRDPAGGPPVARPVEPGTFPLAHGVPDRVGLLSGYGNAIVTQVAVSFILASLDAIANLKPGVSR